MISSLKKRLAAGVWPGTILLPRKLPHPIKESSYGWITKSSIVSTFEMVPINGTAAIVMMQIDSVAAKNQ